MSINQYTATTRFLPLAGDLDLVVGNDDGELNYFENVRSATAPVFVQRFGSKNPFYNTEVEEKSVPALVDLDGDGTLRPCPSIDKS